MIDKIPNSDKLSEKDNVIVTGSGGLYGNAVQIVVKKLKLKGNWYFLRRKDGDLTSLEQTEKIFKKFKPTYVIHLAAFVGGLFYNMSHKIDFWLKNVNINNNVLVCCDKFKVKKVVSCLSTCIFPDKIEKYPITEKIINDGPPHFSNDAYAYAKRMMGLMGKWFKEDGSKTCYVNVIPCNLYGPHDNFHLKHAHVLPALIHKCYLAKKNKGKFVVWGSGKPLRQFLYSIDAAELMIWSLLNYKDQEKGLILADCKREYSIAEMAKIITKTMGYKDPITFDKTKADGQFKKTCSNAKLMKLYPEYKFTPIEKGMQESVDWFLNNLDSFRK